MTSAETVSSPRWVLWTSLAAALLVVAHTVSWDVVRYDDGGFIADSAKLVGVGSTKANLFGLSLVADMLGSYLFTIPATVVLRRRLRADSPGDLVDVLALSGVAYALIGAITAAALATAGPPLIRQFADGVDSASAATSFASHMHAALGVFQIPGVICGGVWWLGSGLLVRRRWKWFGTYSAAFGALSIALGLAKCLGASLDFSLPATVAFAPIAIWIGWLGLCLSKGPDVTPLA